MSVIILDHKIEMRGHHFDRLYMNNSESINAVYNAFDGKKLSQLVISVQLDSQDDCEQLIKLLYIHKHCFINPNTQS